MQIIPNAIRRPLLLRSNTFISGADGAIRSGVSESERAGNKNWAETSFPRAAVVKPSLFPTEDFLCSRARNIFSKLLLAAALGRKTEQKHFYSLESN